MIPIENEDGEVVGRYEMRVVAIFNGFNAYGDTKYYYMPKLMPVFDRFPKLMIDFTDN